MEEYKSKMSGLIGKIRDGLKETRQEGRRSAAKRRDARGSPTRGALGQAAQRAGDGRREKNV
jgi:hypothetical protein